MSGNQRTVFGAVVIAACATVATRAQEAPKSGAMDAKGDTSMSMSPKGGHLAKTARHQFEVFFYKTGLRIFPWSVAGAPPSVSKLTGTATITVPGAAKPFVYPLQATAPTAGRPPESLDVSVDLSRLPATGTTVTCRIEGLSDLAEPAATFTLPVVLPQAPTPTPTPARAAAPARVARPSLALKVSRASGADQAAISAQKVCKVSGEPLGSMGVPIKITRGDRAIFLCCQGCVSRVQSNPDRYFGAPRS